MKRRDIVIGLVVLLILAGIGYWRVRTRQPQIEEIIPSVEERLEEAFNLIIPEDVEKAVLEDIDSEDSSGLSTRDYVDGQFSLTILADLPEPEVGVYQGWLQKGEEGDEDFSQISLGKMRVAKGGWILELESSLNYSDFDTVIVSQEETFDKNLETKVLEGSFE